MVLRETEDYEEGLDRDLDYSLPEERGAKEHAKGDQEVPAEESSQIEEGVGNLWRGKSAIELTEAKRKMAMKACF